VQIKLVQAAFCIVLLTSRPINCYNLDIVADHGEIWVFTSVDVKTLKASFQYGVVI